MIIYLITVFLLFVCKRRLQIKTNKQKNKKQKKKKKKKPKTKKKKKKDKPIEVYSFLYTITEKKSQRGELGILFIFEKDSQNVKKGKRKVQIVPQSQTAALPRPRGKGNRQI